MIYIFNQPIYTVKTRHFYAHTVRLVHFQKKQNYFVQLTENNNKKKQLETSGGNLVISKLSGPNI